MKTKFLPPDLTMRPVSWLPDSVHPKVKRIKGKHRLAIGLQKLDFSKAVVHIVHVTS